MDTEETLNDDGAAALLHADLETVRLLARKGELPGAKIGRSWVFLRSDVLAFLRERIEKDTAQRRRIRVTATEPLAHLVSVPPRRQRRPPPTLPALPTKTGGKPLP